MHIGPQIQKEDQVERGILLMMIVGGDYDDDCSKLTRKYISTRKEEAGGRSSPASHLLPKSDKSVKFLGTLRNASHRETQIHQSQVRKYFIAKNKYIEFGFGYTKW